MYCQDLGLWEDVCAKYSGGAYTNFEGEVEQFETLGFQPRMLDFHNQNHQMQAID